MNKLKKTMLGIAVAGLAFGFSAFTTLKSANILRYYKIDYTGTMDPQDTQGYFYYSGDRCEPGGDLCSAYWDIGINLPPGEGDPLPLTGVTLIPGTVTAGHFE